MKSTEEQLIVNVQYHHGRIKINLILIIVKMERIFKILKNNCIYFSMLLIKLNLYLLKMLHYQIINFIKLKELMNQIIIRIIIMATIG